jgi:F-type H+-transporting ATPase subunit beta
MTVTEPTSTPTGADLKDGHVVAIAGPVVDAEFPRGHLPDINTAVEFTVSIAGEETIVMGEVAQQIGDSRVRIVALKPTDGLRRGQAVRNLGHGLQMPVGDAVLGHVLNVTGQVLDTDALENVEDHWDIHREPPAFDSLEP